MLNPIETSVQAHENSHTKLLFPFSSRAFLMATETSSFWLVYLPR